MKTLVEYISEACDKKSQCSSSKTLTFNFSGLDKEEETLNSAKELLKKMELKLK